MGLDIHIRFENDADFFTAEGMEELEAYFCDNNLSRTFANMMLGRHVAEGIPELEQIFEFCG